MATPLVIGRLHHGVSLFLVPLIGMGCNLVEKANTFAIDGVKAYHFDGHRSQDDFLALRTRLNILTLDRTGYLFTCTMLEDRLILTWWCSSFREALHLTLDL